MPIAGQSRFPSAITRDRSSGGNANGLVRRRGPSAAQLAMMTADELRDHYRLMGQWQGADMELISNMQNPETKGRN